jgi:hypothetical protein
VMSRSLDKGLSKRGCCCWYMFFCRSFCVTELRCGRYNADGIINADMEPESDSTKIV